VPTDRIRQTLDYLVKIGPTSFRIFLEALILTGNVNLVRELDPDYADSEDCKNFIKNEGKLHSPASLITRMGNSKTPEQTRSALISQQLSSCSANVTSHQFRTSPHLNYELNSVSSYFMLPANEYHLTKRLYFNL
jgi:hypothetical protein